MNIKEFLIDLSQNEKALDRFTNDPEGAMSEAGLSAEEKAAINSADRAEIAKLVEVDNSSAGLGLKVKVKVTIHLDVKTAT